jgi:hypothetical protein
MGTRGIIAVVAGGAWRGFEVPLDAGPDVAGVALLAALRTHGLVATRERIREARLVPRLRERAAPETHDARGDLQWAYFLEATTLRVFRKGLVASPNAPSLSGSWEEVSTHTIAVDGTATPPGFQIEERAPWPLIPIDDSWDPTEGPVLSDDTRVSDTEALARLETRRRFARHCAETDLALDEAHRLLEALVIERLVQAPRVYVCRQWTADSKYWTTQLGDRTLVYAPPGWGRDRAIVTETTDGVTREALTLYADGRQAEVEIQRSVWPAGPLTSVLRTAFLGPQWIFSIFDLLRARANPDGRGEVLERKKQSPEQATDWEVYAHPDGRVWSIRPSTKGFQLRLGDPDDDPVFKDRAGSPAAAITEQLAEGFVRRSS